MLRIDIHTLWRTCARLFRSLASFSGSRARASYFLASFAVTALALLFLGLVYQLSPLLPDTIFWCLLLIAFLVFTWLSICLAAHRLRDAGFPPWIAFALETMAVFWQFAFFGTQEEYLALMLIPVLLLLLPSRPPSRKPSTIS